MTRINLTYFFVLFFYNVVYLIVGNIHLTITILCWVRHYEIHEKKFKKK